MGSDFHFFETCLLIVIVLDQQKIGKNNTIESKNVITIDYFNSLFKSEDKRTQLVGVGARDIIAITMPDAVLVAKKNRAKILKKLSKNLKKKVRNKWNLFQKSIDLGSGWSH